MAAPTLGPCASWITAEDVESCCPVADCSECGFDFVAEEASLALFEISGRQYTGQCTRTVRPCRDACGCFGESLAAGSSLYYWSVSAWPGGGWAWRNECGDMCGCGPLSRVKLAGYPVTDIVQVKVDGAVVASSGYRLDGYRWLVRLSDPGPPVVPHFWPSCQDLSLADTQPGTFSVTYHWGIDPPQLGRRAASQLACELYKACSGVTCSLPSGVTKVERQGITVERGVLANWLDPKKPTGLAAIDLFLQAYWNGKRGGRRPALWTPDGQPYARKVG